MSEPLARADTMSLPTVTKVLNVLLHPFLIVGKKMATLISTTPSTTSNVPAADLYKLDDHTQGLLAIRTTTTILGRLQRHDMIRITDTEPVPGGSLEHRELQIYSALAAVAIINHDVVAVTADVTVQGHLKYRADCESETDHQPPKAAAEAAPCTTVRVVATAGKEDNAQYEPEPVPKSNVVHRVAMIMIMVIKNFFRSDPTPAPMEDPLIKSTERPGNLASDGDDAILDYLKEYP